MLTLLRTDDSLKRHVSILVSTKSTLNKKILGKTNVII